MPPLGRLGVVGPEGATAAGGGAVSGAWAARGSCCSSSRPAVPAGLRRRRLLDGPAVLSGLAVEAGGAATAGGSGRIPLLPPRLRRRRDGVAGPAGPARAGPGTRSRSP